MKREEVIQRGLIEEEVMRSIPLKCECGGEVEFTDSASQIYCTSEVCHFKVAAKLSSMMDKLGLEGWGDTSALNVVKEHNFLSHFLICRLKVGELKGINVPEKRMREFLNKVNEGIELWEFVSLAGIDGIDTSAEKIFSEYSSIEEAYKDLSPYEISRRLGLKTVGIRSNALYHSLVKRKNELKFGETYFNIETKEDTGETSIRVAITGHVEGYKNKKEFIRAVGDELGVSIKLDSSTKKESTDIVLSCQGESTSSKYEKALKYGITICHDIGEFKEAIEGIIS